MLAMSAFMLPQHGLWASNTYYLARKENVDNSALKQVHVLTVEKGYLKHPPPRETEFLLPQS